MWQVWGFDVCGHKKRKPVFRTCYYKPLKDSLSSGDRFLIRYAVNKKYSLCIWLTPTVCNSIVLCCFREISQKNPLCDKVFCSQRDICYDVSYICNLSKSTQYFNKVHLTICTIKNYCYLRIYFPVIISNSKKTLAQYFTSLCPHRTYKIEHIFFGHLYFIIVGGETRIDQDVDLRIKLLLNS